MTEERDYTPTKDELKVLQEKSVGCTNKEAGLELRMSEGSVKTHLIHVHMWMGVSDGTRAVYRVLEAGLIKGPEQYTPPIPLTEDELVATQLLVYGFENEQIAQAMGKTKHAVKDFLKEAMLKYDAKNRTHLMALAYIDGVIK